MSEQGNERYKAGIVCGATTCPTCSRPSEVLIGPCLGCHESFNRTGRFLRRQTVNQRGHGRRQ